MAESDLQVLERPALHRVPSPRPPRWLAGGIAEARRIAMGAAGPVAVAGSQFAASLLLWAHVSAQAFGLFALLILLVQFSQGLSNALVGTPIAVAPRDESRDEHRSACLAAHGLFLAAVAAAVGLVFLVAGERADVPSFVVLAVAANLRWAARAYAIAEERVAASTLSDSLYGLTVAALLGLLFLSGEITAAGVALALAGGHALALVLLSRRFLARQVAALNRASLRHYRRRIWRRQARWSLLGVISTEASSNSHAYVVTWLCGAAAYAPLAFASLFCRPLSIVLTALTQIDRPVFVRLLGEGAAERVRGLLRMNFVAVAAIWLGNAALGAAVLWLFEDAIVARGYASGEIRLAVALWFAIMALRAARNPLATFAQASHAFQPLAYCSAASAGLAMVAVPLFALVGPTYSLLGTLCGEVLLAGMVVALARRHLP